MSIRILTVVSQSADDLAMAANEGGIPVLAVRKDTLGGNTPQVTDGDLAVPRIDLNRHLLVGGAQLDDGGFAVGSPSRVFMIGALADEVATDSVDENDGGALRMTLNRRLITAGHLLDDAAFGVATDYVTPIAGLADEVSPDSVDEGDVGAVAMTLARELYIRPMRRGAGEVKGTFLAFVTDSTVRATLLTPTVGKKVRILSVHFGNAAVATRMEAYFGTGASITTTVANYIHHAHFGAARERSSLAWPDGAGPVGAVDAVVSIRTTVDISGNGEVGITYREE